MAELFWFKFFSGEYLGDPRVDDSPREAEGLLVRIWCVCHREGSCPADFATLARKTHCSIEYVARYFRFCEPFFEKRDGRLYSVRMEQERQRSEIARQNANQRYQKNQKPKSKAKNLERESSEHGSANRSANGIADGTAKIARSHAVTTIRPSLDEVRAYCALRQNHVNPERFVDYHEANGWKQKGGNRIVDWRAAVRNWERNGVDTNGQQSKAEQRYERQLAEVWVD